MDNEEIKAEIALARGAIYRGDYEKAGQVLADLYEAIET